MQKVRLSIAIVVLLALHCEADQGENSRRMTFLQFGDARFIDGLKKHEFSTDYGLRILNTGFVVSPFGPRWIDSPALRTAQSLGRPYYIDRITGGMPFQPLDGITDVALRLKDDPNFLGFQVHEWGNSPLADYGRIQKHIVGKGLAINKETFDEYEGRTKLPFFSGGTYETYQDVYRPLKKQSDVEKYLEEYFSKLVRLTQGQVVSVTGHFQLHHTALRLGAKNVMAEIGNQVPLTALQIACARGAAREHGKPFGVYYETWGGTPFGCTCATDFSPWFANKEQFDNFHDMGSVGGEYGSGRMLHRRLLYFAWLSGAAYWAEEWGAENYFANWDDYPITEYGRLTKAFQQNTAKFGPVTPITPAAIVLPTGTFGLHVTYIADDGHNKLFNGLAQPDGCHVLLKKFAARVLAAHRREKPGSDSHNLTSSPWIGCFDVLSAEASPNLLSSYDVLLFLDAEQADAADVQGPLVHVFTGQEADTENCLNDIQKSLPFRVAGEVGCAQAQTSKKYLVGLFNNLGVTKTSQGESGDPTATRQVSITGRCAGLEFVTGSQYVRTATEKSVTLELPAGSVALLSFDQP